MLRVFIFQCEYLPLAKSKQKAFGIRTMTQTAGIDEQLQI